VRLVAHDVDVVCVVRGGGSQSDLAAFDHESVARAVATCRVPVLTGIGHTGDVSVTDLVAHEAHRTPTACAEALTSVVGDWYVQHVGDAAQRLTALAGTLLGEADDGVRQRRRHVAVVARHRVDRAHDRVAHVAAATARKAPHALARSTDWVSSRSARLVPVARHGLESAHDALAARRALLDAYDPARLLARGWSITTDERGRALRTTRELEVGASLVTRFADGVARSTVTELEGSV
jgi:exodeoxyribonuclease VII large subunit